jgi:hypothetical protein
VAKKRAGGCETLREQNSAPSRTRSTARLETRTMELSLDPSWPVEAAGGMKVSEGSGNVQPRPARGAE